MDEGKILLQIFFCGSGIELKPWNGSQMSSTMGVKSLNPWHWPIFRLSDITNQWPPFWHRKASYLLRVVGEDPWPARGSGSYMVQHSPPPAIPGLLTERTTLLQECEDGSFGPSSFLGVFTL